MNESSRQRMVFALYIRMGPERSLAALARVLRNDPAAVGLHRPPARSTLERWSTMHQWQDRLADLERQDRLRAAEAQVQALRDMNDRHRKEGLALQAKASERIAAIPAGEMSASDAI